jgi:hypothetical protein
MTGHRGLRRRAGGTATGLAALAFSVAWAVGPTAVSAAPSPVPVVAPSYVRPVTVDGPVPSNLRPSLAAAAKDYPKAEVDGCHVQLDGKSRGASCLYDSLASKTTIAVFGDSHALGWFPAVDAIAKSHGWRFLNLTMSACSPADIHQYIPAWHRVSTECAAWRESAIKRLISIRPAIILVTGTRGFELADGSGTVLTGDARTAAWQAGMSRTLARLRPIAGRVIQLADTPISQFDPLTCLAAHPSSLLACATPVSMAINTAWLNIEMQTASMAKVGFINPSLWVCPSSPCPVVIGSVLVLRNAGHMTATFAVTMTHQLEQALGLPQAATLGH